MNNVTVRHRVQQALFFLLLPTAFAITSTAYASCAPGASQDAPPLFFDATDALNMASTSTFASATNYPSSFKCSPPAWWVIGGKNKVTNSSPYTNNNVYVKFPGNAYVKITVNNIIPSERNPAVGDNSGSSINANFNITLQLVKNPGSNVMVANGDTIKINPLLIAQDSTGLTIIQNIARLVADIASFLIHWEWPKHNYDIYYQPLILKFVKHQTTCSFDDNNKTVMLDRVDRASLANGTVNGKKNFTLHFSCHDLWNGATTRPVKAWLSSVNLLTGDSNTLISSDKNSARGVGIRLAMASNGIPVKISASSNAAGNATPLFSYKASQAIGNAFTVDMSAYYYVYDKSALSVGRVNTTAIVNFTYD